MWCMPSSFIAPIVRKRRAAGTLEAVQALTTVDQDALRRLRARDEFFWLDLDDPDGGAIDALGDTLGLHRLAVEDTREFGQRPKVDEYGDELLVVYYGARSGEGGAPIPVEVHLHIGPGFVVTVHRDRCRQFDVVREQFDREPPEDPHAVVYRVIDALTDSIVDVVDTAADCVEAFEAEVFRRPRARDRDRMATLRRAL